MKRLLLCVGLLWSGVAVAQISPERLLGVQERTRWTKSMQTLRKAAAKDSINPETRYLLSLAFFNKSNPAYNLDSSYKQVRKASDDYRKVAPRDKERLRKVPLDSVILKKLHAKIDSAAFADARSLNTEEGYIRFLRTHPGAIEAEDAIELRDEVAYVDALRKNTWTAFQLFVKKYPSSHRATEAIERYEKLLFEERTRDKRLRSYLNFYEQFPSSPYRAETEHRIWLGSTASGKPEAFQWFISHFPKSKWASRAKNILYAMNDEESENYFDPSWMTDSLKALDKLNRKFLVPTYKDGVFGFMNQDGEEIIPPRYASIPESYRCGQITERILVTGNGLIARNGTVLHRGDVDDMEDIGQGFFFITADSGGFVMHESGFLVGPSDVTAAELIAGKFIAVERNRKWSLFSLTGLELLGPYEDVTSYDSMIVLAKNGKKIMTHPQKVSATADHQEFKEEYVFDDTRRWGNQQFWVRNGVLEGVIGPSMNYVIPLDRHVLRKTNFGFMRGKNDQWFVEGVKGLGGRSFKAVQENGSWLRLTAENRQQILFDRTFMKEWTGDSVWFRGQIAFLRTSDSIKVFLPSSQRLSFAKGTPFRMLAYKDSSEWIQMDEKKLKVVYDAASLAKLFSIEADYIEALSPHEMMFIKSGKRGIISEDGKILIPAEYDAIVPDGKDAYSLLKDKKFGWFDPHSKTLIKPIYDRNLKSYNKEFRMAYKDKGYAFIKTDGKPTGLFEWEDVQYWTDTLAWVKKNFQWMLIDIHSQKVRYDKVRGFTALRDAPEEKLFLVRQENAYGVISSRHGLIIPMQYSDIINLGSPEIPLYFTERHIEEAAISVVIYYDHKGKIVRKQAMEADDFEKLVCDN